MPIQRPLAYYTFGCAIRSVALGQLMNGNEKCTHYSCRKTLKLKSSTALKVINYI
jgi:hypothetical protein